MENPSTFQEKGVFSQWWAANGKKLTRLLKITFSMCGVQLSNGGVERVLSYTKLLVEGRRKRLFVENLTNGLHY